MCAFEKDAILIIKSSQQKDDGEVNSMDLTTMATYRREGGAYSLMYEETDMSGLSGVSTVIEVEDGKVNMRRAGDFGAQFMFDAGHEYLSQYNTPFGDLMMGVMATMVEDDLDDDGGELHIRYRLDIQGEFASNNTLDMFVSLMD